MTNLIYLSKKLKIEKKKPELIFFLKKCEKKTGINFTD